MAVVTQCYTTIGLKLGMGVMSKNILPKVTYLLAEPSLNGEQFEMMMTGIEQMLQAIRQERQEEFKKKAEEQAKKAAEEAERAKNMPPLPPKPAAPGLPELPPKPAKPAASGDLFSSMEMGGDDFIAKPFDLSVLTAKVQAVLRRAYEFSGMRQPPTS